MARARNIKPGFFTNDILAEIDPLGRILFAGLWTIADREGRLENRPNKIKIQTLPYDECDIPNLLNELQKRNFILLYTVENNNYIQILEFKKHQNPHVNEGSSTIQAPNKHSTSTVQSTSLNGTTRADSLLPITDSGFPSTDLSPPSAKTKKNGTALPENWVLPKSWGDWALAKRPDLGINGIREQADSFKDHWLANANQRNGKKADWVATWRNWIRRCAVIKTNSVQDARLDIANQIQGKGKYANNGQVEQLNEIRTIESD
jgi:hypothetical protein